MLAVRSLYKLFRAASRCVWRPRGTEGYKYGKGRLQNTHFHTDHFGLGLTSNLSIFDEDRLCAKNDFYIFILNDLDLWPLDLDFSPLITFVCTALYVSTKFSTAFLFRESEGPDGQTDGVQRLMRSPREGGPHNK